MTEIPALIAIAAVAILITLTFRYIFAQADNPGEQVNDKEMG